MSDHLPPNELARIKREGRARRIGKIRRRVMALGATLAAVFSGIVRLRSSTNQPAASSSSRSELTQPAPAQDQVGLDSGFDSVDLGAAVVGIVTSALSDSNEESSGSAPLTTSQS